MKARLHGEEYDNTAQYPFDDTRRGSSISTVTLGRDLDMLDDGIAHSDEDGHSSQPGSNYGYVQAANCPASIVRVRLENDASPSGIGQDRSMCLGASVADFY